VGVILGSAASVHKWAWPTLLPAPQCPLHIHMYRALLSCVCVCFILHRMSVRRDMFLNDAFSKVMAISKKDLQKAKLFISFTGEEGFVYLRRRNLTASEFCLRVTVQDSRWRKDFRIDSRTNEFETGQLAVHLLREPKNGWSLQRVFFTIAVREFTSLQRCPRNVFRIRTVNKEQLEFGSSFFPILLHKKTKSKCSMHCSPSEIVFCSGVVQTAQTNACGINFQLLSIFDINVMKYIQRKQEPRNVWKHEKT